MADVEEIHQIKDLANLCREKGMLDTELSEEVDSFVLPILLPDTLGNVNLIFQPYGEFTNRLYLEDMSFDVREDTFTGVRYPVGSPVKLQEIHKALKECIDSMNGEIKAESDSRIGQEFSIKDGQGKHKL